MSEEIDEERIKRLASSATKFELAKLLNIQLAVNTTLYLAISQLYDKDQDLTNLNAVVHNAALLSEEINGLFHGTSETENKLVFGKPIGPEA